VSLKKGLVVSALKCISESAVPAAVDAAALQALQSAWFRQNHGPWGEMEAAQQL